MMASTFFTILYLSVVGGAIGVLGKIALASFSPIQLIFLRIVITVIFFGAYFLYKRKLKFAATVTARHAAAFIFLAVAGVGGGMILGFLGLSLTTAINYDLLFNTSAIFMALFAPKIRKSEVGLFALAFLGAALLVTNGKFVEPIFDSANISGDILVLFGAIGWALYSMGGRMLGAKDPNVTADIQVAAPFLFAAMALGVYIAIYEPFNLAQFFNLKAVAAAVVLAFVATAGLFFIWFKFLRSASGILAGIVTLSENIGGILFPALILGERLTFISGIGAAMIISAVVLYEYWAESAGIRGVLE